MACKSFHFKSTISPILLIGVPDFTEGYEMQKIFYFVLYAFWYPHVESGTPSATSNLTKPLLSVKETEDFTAEGQLDQPESLNTYYTSSTS